MSLKLITTKGFYYNSMKEIGLIINLSLFFANNSIVNKTDCFLITWE